MRLQWPFLSAVLCSTPPRTILRLPVPHVRTSSLSAAGRLIDQKMNGWKTEFVATFVISWYPYRYIPLSPTSYPTNHLSMFRSALRHQYHTETREPWSGYTRSSMLRCTSVYFTRLQFGACFFCTRRSEHLFPFPSSQRFRLLSAGMVFPGWP